MCKPDRECLHLSKEVLFRTFAKSALDAGTDVSLSGEGAEAAEAVQGLLWGMPEAFPLFSPLDGLLL